MKWKNLRMMNKKKTSLLTMTSVLDEYSLLPVLFNVHIAGIE
jgi:hypothetical protein